MSDEQEIHTVRVFVDSGDRYGNPIGIVIDEQKKLDTEKRQSIAKKLGYSESVFINGVNIGNVSIFNPRHEVSFAGHALVGTSWFIKKINKKPPQSLTCMGGNILTWQKDGFTWIRANTAMLPPWNIEQLENADDVENSNRASKNHTIVWAWIDKNKGTIRARTFAPDWGIPEDEANGSGSMLLAAKLNRKLEIIHGKGSIIYTQPFENDLVDVGGRVMDNLKVIKSL